MIDWAKEQMPRLESKTTFFMGSGVSGETRSEWVDRMVVQAKKRLQMAEKGVKNSFQDLDNKEEKDSENDNNNSNSDIGGVLPDEEGAWQ